MYNKPTNTPIRDIEEAEVEAPVLVVQIQDIQSLLNDIHGGSCETGRAIGRLFQEPSEPTNGEVHPGKSEKEPYTLSDSLERMIKHLREIRSIVSKNNFTLNKII